MSDEENQRLKKILEKIAVIFGDFESGDMLIVGSQILANYVIYQGPDEITPRYEKAIEQLKHDIREIRQFRPKDEMQ